jgi:hypothetical protein
MSLDAMNAVWLHSEQKGNALLTLLAIADNANDDGFAFPSYKHLAAKTRLSQRTVQNIVSELLQSNELALVTSGTWGASNVYSVEVAALRDKPRRIGKMANGLPPDQMATQVATPDGNLSATPTVSSEPSGIEPSGNSGDGGAIQEAGTLPGFEPPPSPAKKPSIPPKVQEIWDHYLSVFGDRTRIKELTDARIRTLTKALKAVADDGELCCRAVDGLKSYRDNHPDGSNRVDLGTIFETNPRDSKNLTDKIEGWAAMAKDNAALPGSVPSVMRARVLELAVEVLTIERQPDNSGVRERGELAQRILRERFGLKVTSDGKGKLVGWQNVPKDGPA